MLLEEVRDVVLGLEILTLVLRVSFDEHVRLPEDLGVDLKLLVHRPLVPVSHVLTLDMPVRCLGVVQLLLVEP